MKVNSTSISIGQLLKDGKIYSIPIFQRSYSWEKIQITDFWSDIINLYVSKEKDDDYFIGAMVFTPQGNNKIKILDGQQRFATILLFLSSLRDILKPSNIIGKDKWIDEIDRIIYTRDIPTLEETCKLELNKEDKDFFNNVVIKGNIPQSKYNSHNLIKDAYGFFKEKIFAELEKDKEQFVKGILDVIINKLLMIRIDIDSDTNANMIFETLNDRGLELSVSDLVKNYIFSISSDEQLETIIQIWKEIVDQVGDYNVTKFLRHYWISSCELVRKEELYKRIKNKVKTSNVKIFIEQLAKEASIYANLNNPTHEFWEDIEIEKIIEELNILKVEQVNILLLALHINFYKKKEIFKKLLKVLINFTFRYNTICGFDPKALEKLYGSLAIKVRENKINKKRIIEEINKNSPSKDKFIASFNDIEIKNGKLAKYILTEINNYMLKTSGNRELIIDKNKTNLEHIIPKKPNDKWKRFFKENNMSEECIYKLGNMTILLKEYNKKISNQFFDKKKEMYKKSQIPLTNELNNYNKFSSNEIKERQQKMSEIAENLWKV
jgi:uncharacterized protein with ParB-like and HNH nuclease domain